jgi:hypothetical protein
LFPQGPKSEIPNWFSGHSLTVSNFRRSSVISYYGDELEEDERVEDVWRPALWSEIETRSGLLASMAVFRGVSRGSPKTNTKLTLWAANYRPGPRGLALQVTI